MGVSAVGRPVRHKDNVCGVCMCVSLCMFATDQQFLWCFHRVKSDLEKCPRRHRLSVVHMKWRQRQRLDGIIKQL